MTFVRKNLKYLLFTGVLLTVISLRSGLMVDTSFLPRFFLLAAILLAAAIFLLNNPVSLPAGIPEVALVFYMIWNFLSIGWAGLPSEALMQALLVFLSGALYFIMVILAGKNPCFEKIFTAWIILFQIFTFALAFYRMAQMDYYDPYQVRSVSANNNLYAGLLLLTLPFNFSGYSLFRGFLRWLAVATGIAALFFIVILQSRAVYLGLGVAIMLFIMISVISYRRVINRRNVAVSLVSLALLAGSISIFYHSLDHTRRQYFLNKIPVWQYFRSYDEGLDNLLAARQKEKAALTGLPEFDFAGSYYENANFRIIFWKKSICLFENHPFTGVGAGNWRIFVASCPRPVNPDHIFKNYTYSQPHNEWIGILTELGIPGLLAALTAFLLLPVMVSWNALKCGRAPALSTSIQACFLIGFSLFAFFDFPLRRVEHSVLFFTLLAFLRIRFPLKKATFCLRNGMVQTVLAILATVLVFSLITGWYRLQGEFWTLRMFRKEGRDHRQVILLSSKAVSPFYKITPNGLPPDWFSGVALFRLAHPDSALIAFDQALKITPYEVRVINDHATALYTLGRVAEAKKDLLNALAIDPCFDDARFNLAAIYVAENNLTQAIQMVSQCRESSKKSLFLKEISSVSQ